MPRNAGRDLFNPEKSTVGEAYTGQYGGEPRKEPDGVCAPPGTSNFILPGPPPRKGPPLYSETRMLYSPGDRFNITVPGMDDFTGDYAINADGRVILPFAGEIQAVGLSNPELQKRIERAFIKAGVFREDGLKISVRPVQYAPINIYVSGAVFDPGRAVINNLKDSDKTEKFMTKFGDAPLDRYVPSAIHSAGGVRPDADVSHIKLIRGGKVFELNWRGAFTGEPVDDMPLIEGDRIDVPEAPCFQSGLIRPSQITTPGIHISISNLTQPALSNASSAITKDTVGVSYGTTFLQALVSGNCVGGTFATNASRHAVLISRNPKTRRTEVIQRSIEELVRSPDRDALNPQLMPEDAVACYDSGVIDGQSVISLLGSALGGASQGKSLRGW